MEFYEIFMLASPWVARESNTLIYCNIKNLYRIQTGNCQRLFHMTSVKQKKSTEVRRQWAAH